MGVYVNAYMFEGNDYWDFFLIYFYLFFQPKCYYITDQKDLYGSLCYFITSERLLQTAPTSKLFLQY